MRPRIVMDFRRVVAPVNRLVDMSKDELFESFVLRSQLNKVTKGVPFIGEELGDLVADAFRNASVVTA